VKLTNHHSRHTDRTLIGVKDLQETALLVFSALALGVSSGLAVAREGYGFCALAQASAAGRGSRNRVPQHRRSFAPVRAVSNWAAALR